MYRRTALRLVIHDNGTYECDGFTTDADLVELARQLVCGAHWPRYTRVVVSPERDLSEALGEFRPKEALAGEVDIDKILAGTGEPTIH